jgi:hypothetical protein
MIAERACRMRRRAIAVLAATIMVFAGLAVLVGFTVSLPPDVLERKVAAAERHLYYRITHTTGPVFELNGDETSLRLIVHAVVPGAVYDPARELELGVRVELLQGTPWRRDLYTRARQSKARPMTEHGLWLDENTFSLHRGIELTDDRQLVVPLPASVSAGTKVRVTLLGDVHEGIVRAYTPVVRSNVDRRVAAMRAVDREHVAAQLGVGPWDHVAATRELASLRFAEHRLSAEGEEGKDYEIREVYTTGFRIRDDRVVESGVLIAEDRSAAINVIGPAELEVVAERVDPLDRAGASLVANLLGEAPPIAPVQLALAPGGATARRTISIPSGVFTLSLAASRPTRIELTTKSTASVTLAGHAGSPVVPDVQRLTTYLAKPDGEPLKVALAGPDDQLGRAVRIDVRPLAAREVTLALEAIDDNKHSLASVTTKVESQLSQFDLAQLPDQQEARVGEPVAVRFVVPAGGRELRIRSDAPAVVTISTPLATSTDVIAPPYDRIALTTLVWRYARFAERSWLTMRPSNLDMLGSERVVTVLAQARLEPRQVPPPPESVGTTLAPSERLERQTMIERVAAEDVADVLAHWSASHHTRLVPGKRLTLDFSRAPDRPSVAYYAARPDADVVGETVTLKLDGEPLPTAVLGSTGGAIDLPRGLTGTHTLEVETTAPVRLLVDRPPVSGGAELYALRTVYRVPDHGEAFHIKVTKRSTGTETVNVVLYTPNAVDPRTTIRALIDRGVPERAEGVALTKWTIADRTVPLPVSDRPASVGFTDVARGGPLRPHLLAIALGDDVLPGTHALELRVTGARPIWGRFFLLDGGTQRGARAVQWRDVDEPSAGSEP